jgi:hypothetical protein
MTQGELLARGRLLLIFCFAVVAMAELAADFRFGVFDAPAKAIARLALIGALAVAAVRGARWASRLVAVVLGPVVLLSIYYAFSLASSFPSVAIWMGAQALALTVVSAVLFFSSSIARYQHSKNELVMP